MYIKDKKVLALLWMDHESRSSRRTHDRPKKAILVAGLAGELQQMGVVCTMYTQSYCQSCRIAWEGRVRLQVGLYIRVAVPGLFKLLEMSVCLHVVRDGMFPLYIYIGRGGSAIRRKDAFRLPQLPVSSRAYEPAR